MWTSFAPPAECLPYSGLKKAWRFDDLLHNPWSVSFIAVAQCLTPTFAALLQAATGRGTLSRRTTQTTCRTHGAWKAAITCKGSTTTAAAGTTSETGGVATGPTRQPIATPIRTTAIGMAIMTATIRRGCGHRRPRPRPRHRPLAKTAHRLLLAAVRMLSRCCRRCQRPLKASMDQAQSVPGHWTATCRCPRIFQA